MNRLFTLACIVILISLLTACDQYVNKNSIDKVLAVCNSNEGLGYFTVPKSPSNRIYVTCKNNGKFTIYNHTKELEKNGSTN